MIVDAVVNLTEVHHTDARIEYSNYSSIIKKVQHLTDFYALNLGLPPNKQISSRMFCKMKELPRPSFNRHLKKIGYKGHKKELCNISKFNAAATSVLSSIEESTKSRSKTACILNQFLSDLEEKAIVTVCTVLCELGLGVSRPELHEMINDYLHDKCCIQEWESTGQKIIDAILRRNPML